MRRRQDIRVSVAIVASLFVASWCHPAAAEPELSLKLEVHAPESPQFLCIVTAGPSCEQKAYDGDTLSNEQYCRTRRLLDFASMLRIEHATEDSGFLPLGLTVFADNRASLQSRPILVAALHALAQPPSPKCEETHSACAPRIDLHGFLDPYDVPNGHIICGQDDASSTGRVAILSLKFHEKPIPVSGITLHGTNATLILEDKLDVKNPAFMQVVGGHYAASTQSVSGISDRVTIAIQSRCTRLVAELPPQLPKPIQSVVLTTGSQATDAAACTNELTKPIKCVSDEYGERMPIQIPRDAASRRTTLSVTTASSDGLDAAMFEASWTDELPSKLRLAVRSLEFSWHRDCLSGTWPEKTPAAQHEWSASCPRATIAEAGAPCRLARDEANVCHYRCTAARGTPPFTLPVKVQFDRIRASTSIDAEAASSDHPGEEVVYSWGDTIHVAGEHLHSFAAPNDRRLFLELTPPELWADHAGDAYDEVRTVLPNGTAQNVELTRTRSGERLPWYEITAPNITCTDRVRIAIFGSHIYNEHTYSARGGRIVLSNPADHRSRLNLWLTTGLGAAEQRLPSPKGDFELTGLLGGHFEQYMSLGAYEIGAIAQVTQTGAVRVNAAGAVSTIDEIPFVRIDFIHGYEFWVTPNLHLGGVAGVGFGVPPFNNDQAVVGFGRPSFVAEVNARIRLARREGLWSEIAAGVRLGEAHRVLPDPGVVAPSHLIRPAQLYFTWRLWFLVG